jgi:hypothetical protein
MAIATPQRLLKQSWLTSWMLYYSKTEVPMNYALWSGIWAINCMLQDKVWIARGTSKLFPNAYIFLIGPGAGGKSTPSRMAAKLIKETNLVDLYAGEMSKSYMVNYLDNLVKRQAPMNIAQNMVPRARLALYSDELAITVGSGPQADDFLRLMTILYDFSFQYGTHAHGALSAQEPIINWLALATLPWLRRSIPPDLVDSGFVARLIAAVEPLSNEIVPKMPQMDPVLRYSLLHDLVQISLLEGEYTFSPAAADYHEEWYVQNKQARLAIGDEITQGIHGREDEQALGVAMSLMAASGHTMEISKRALENAIELITRARSSNERIFRALAENRTFSKR